MQKSLAKNRYHLSDGFQRNYIAIHICNQIVQMPNRIKGLTPQFTVNRHFTLICIVIGTSQSCLNWLPQLVPVLIKLCFRSIRKRLERGSTLTRKQTHILTRSVQSRKQFLFGCYCPMACKHSHFTTVWRIVIGLNRNR